MLFLDTDMVDEVKFVAVHYPGEVHHLLSFPGRHIYLKHLQGEGHSGNELFNR